MEYVVFVTPNAKQDRIEEESDRKLQAWVKSPPHGGKANKNLLKLLRTHFKTNKVEIIKGHKSREKVIRVEIGEA